MMDRYRASLRAVSFSQIGCFVNWIAKLLFCLVSLRLVHDSLFSQRFMHAILHGWHISGKKKTAIDTHLVPPTTSLPANRKCLCLQAIHFPWGDEIPAKFLWTGKHKDTGEMLLHYDHFNARIDFILPFLFHYAVQPKVVSILNPLKPMNYCLLKHCYAKLTISLF